MTESIRKKIHTLINKNKLKMVIFIGIIAFLLYFITLFKEFSKPIAASRVDEAILYALQSSVSIYVKKNHIAPKVFSDFVIERGKIIDNQIMSLENAKPQIDRITGIKTNRLTIVFKGPNYPQTTYYLNGNDVTATYENFNY